MDVYIVRDAVEIGHFPRADIEKLARTGELQATDYYWHEGMEGWLPLPDLLGADAWNPIPETPAAITTPASRPTAAAGMWDRRFVIGALCGASIVVAAIALYFWNSKPSETNPSSARAASPASDLVSRDKAAAELKQKIETLPASATAPLNASYYDVSYAVAASSSAITPWTAVIRGNENIVDPGTATTTKGTEFILTAEYRDGEWTFADYQAVETDTATGATTQIRHDDKSPVPPNLVAMLGLKRR
ncbi:MAG: DUF4339 domain-containing protein [Spartobacteria bacterium]